MLPPGRGLETAQSMTFLTLPSTSVLERAPDEADESSREWTKSIRGQSCPALLAPVAGHGVCPPVGGGWGLESDERGMVFRNQTTQAGFEWCEVAVGCRGGAIATAGGCGRVEGFHRVFVVWCCAQGVRSVWLERECHRVLGWRGRGKG